MKTLFLTLSLLFVHSFVIGQTSSNANIDQFQGEFLGIKLGQFVYYYGVESVAMDPNTDEWTWRIESVPYGETYKDDAGTIIYALTGYEDWNIRALYFQIPALQNDFMYFTNGFVDFYGEPTEKTALSKTWQGQKYICKMEYNVDKEFGTIVVKFL